MERVTDNSGWTHPGRRSMEQVYVAAVVEENWVLRQRNTYRSTSLPTLENCPKVQLANVRLSNTALIRLHLGVPPISNFWTISELGWPTRQTTLAPLNLSSFPSNGAQYPTGRPNKSRLKSRMRQKDRSAPSSDLLRHVAGNRIRCTVTSFTTRWSLRWWSVCVRRTVNIIHHEVACLGGTARLSWRKWSLC